MRLAHDTLDDLIAALYPYPDKQDFADFLRLIFYIILVVRPENRAKIPMLRQRWLTAVSRLLDE
jgi:hypothetical protein